MTICGQLIGREVGIAQHCVVVPKKEDRTRGWTVRVTRGRLTRPVTLDVGHKRIQ